MARLCSVAGCGLPHNCKGYCRKHYQRVAKYGHPRGGPTTHAPPEVKFWRYVEKRGPEECWPWIGKRQPTGYGRMGVGARKQVGAHRLSFKIATGEEPPVVMHTCDNPWCVNPAHLRGGTHADNTADMLAKGRNGKTGARGESHHRAKLTEAMVREIKARPNEKPGKLAAEFGVKSAVVQRIRRGLAWTHIT
jgi:hypothetical protein